MLRRRRSEMGAKLRMFVWREVLCDNTDGIAVALAHDEAEARAVLLRDADDTEREALESDIEKPADEVYSMPHGIYMWGGG
jgi:hypothetical protein